MQDRIEHKCTRRRIAGFDDLVTCCAAAFDPSRPVAILATSQGAGEHLTLLARRHRVQGLVVQALGKAAPAALVADARQIVAQNLRAESESQRLQSAFDRENVAMLFLKGVSLGCLAWPHPMAKMSWDVDLLVAPPDLKAAATLLEGLGYRQEHPRPPADLDRWHANTKESEWRHLPSGTTVELHTRATENAMLSRGIDPTAERQSVQLQTGQSIDTLAPAPLFAYLCAHGAASAWFRLKWLADLAALIARTDATVVTRWVNEAPRWTSSRVVGQALLLVERLFGPLLAPELLSGFSADRPTRLLADAAERQMAGPNSLPEPTERAFGTVLIHATQLFLVPGLRFSLGEALRQVREVSMR